MQVHVLNKQMEDHQKLGLKWIVLVFMSPIACLLLILMAWRSLLRFLLKAMLLFIIVAINTPFAVMMNSSILVLNSRNSNFDPRVTVGIEIKIIVSDFFKVIAAEFLLVMSTGVITFYTAPRKVFYVSMAAGVTAIGLKWLNTSSSSKIAFSCFCDGYGLNPMMFFFSFIGLFDIGCHPIAKCSFAALKAFLFIKKDPDLRNGGKDLELLHLRNGGNDPDLCHGGKDLELCNGGNDPNLCNGGHKWTPFNAITIDPTNTRDIPSIEFSEWNAFERGLFQLFPRIDFDIEETGKSILQSYMVLKIHGRNVCDYHVERLELPEDYSKFNELYNFLVDLSEKDGFVTDKMRGRYEHSLTLL